MKDKIWKTGTLVYTSGGLALLFFWLLFGDFAWSMRDRSVAPMAQWYLSSLNVPNLLFGLLVTSFPALLTIIVGPIISVKSDRHRGKWGRRIPFLLITTPLGALGMIGLGLTPFFAEWVHGFFPGQSRMMVAVACFGLFWAAFEVATIAGHAVFGGLINDVVPRELLGRFYGLFRAVSLIDGVIFNYWIMGHVPEYFTLIMVLVGVFYGAAFMWVCLKVREGEYPPPVSEENGGEWKGPVMGFMGEARRYFRECFSSRYYLSVFVLMQVSLLAFLPVNIFSIPYAHSLGVDMDIYGKCLALTFLISFLLSFFLGWLADILHPLRMAMITLAAYLMVALLGYEYAVTPKAFLVTWVAHGVLSGCYYTSAASLGQRLFPHSRFAQFMSAAAIFAAFANMALAPMMGLIVDRSGGIFQYTFLVGGVTAFLALLAGFYVHRRFMLLGGPKGYVAPE